jgi:hypothetical protein
MLLHLSSKQHDLLILLPKPDHPLGLPLFGLLEVLILEVVGLFRLGKFELLDLVLV